MKYRSLFDRKGLSLDRLAAFCEVAETGSIVAATGGDPTRQALVSRQISELESFFEVSLVERQGRGLILTEAGRELAFLIREHLRGLEEFASSQKGTSWTVRVLASNSIGQWLILPRLAKLHQEWPELRMQLQHEQTREMIRQVQEGIFDLAVVRKEGSPLTGLESAPLGNLTYSLFIPKSLSKSLPSRCRLPRALTSLPLALPVGGSMRQRIEQIAAQEKKPLTVLLECSSYMQAAEALRSGPCAAILPDMAISEPEQSHYQRIPLSENIPISLIWKKRSAERNPRLAQLIKSLTSLWKIGESNV